MIGRHTLSAVFGALAISTAGCAQLDAMDTDQGNDMMPNSAVTMIDIHQVTDIEGARDYATWIDGVGARNGVDIKQIYEVADVSAGEFSADVVFLFGADDPSALAALGSDPEYQARVPERDRIFKMPDLVRYAVKPLVSGRDDLTSRLKDPAKADWITLIDIHNTNDKTSARDYAEWVAGVADRNGVEILQIYEVLETAEGSETADVVFFFRAPSPNELGALGQDAEYAQRVPERDRTFRMSEMRRFAVKPMIQSNGM